MTRYYFDTSALVKRYVSEQGTESVVALLKEATGIYVASVAYVEVVMALRRKREEGSLDEPQFAHLLSAFDEEWQGLDRVGLTELVLRVVREQCLRYPLRALDAIHLASALLLHQRGLRFEFVCSDERLKQAASFEGLSVIDPTVPL